MNQSEKRYLIERLLAEQPRYKKIRVPESPDEQKTFLKSLMNIRMPGNISENFLRIQDE